MEAWTQLFITLILTIIITCHIRNADHDIMITLTLSEDRMEIKKKKKLANEDLTVSNVCDAPPPPKHTHPKKTNKTRKNKTCLLRVISQVDEIFKNKQTKKKNS